MKKSILLLVMIIVSCLNIFAVYADDEPRHVIEQAVEHLNAYLLEPITIDDEDVTWDWAIVTGQDIVEGCRVDDNPALAITDVYYEVNIYRLDAHYHYRITMDEAIILRCEPLPAVPDNILPQVIDALSDLNARNHMSFTHNDLPWTWAEHQFEDYTLDCNLNSDDSPYDRRTNGYIVRFKLQGETWEYRVSADRLIVVLCETDA